MNGYVKKFQASKPQMHDLHADMIQLIQDFLALFLSSEKVPSALSEFSNFNVSKTKQLSSKKIAVGEFAYQGIQAALKADPFWIGDFFLKLREGYVQAATILMEKLPIYNKTLIRLSCLNPASVGKDPTATGLLNLGKQLTNVVKVQMLYGILMATTNW